MQFQQYSHPDDAPTELWISGLTQDSVGYTTGLAATDRPELPGYNSGILCMVIEMMLLVIFNARHYGRFFRRLVKNVWSIRVRTNLFDEHTVNETRIMVALIVQVCVCESLLGVTWMTSHGYTFTSGGLAAAAAIGTLITCLYYVAQIVVYRIVGYAFTSRLLCIQWIQGFNSTQILLGFALLVPTLISLFYPSASEGLITVSVCLYILARIVFICKGFRIFYHNFFSLTYFILYLCSVEIIPLILVYRGISSICCNFLS